MTLRKLCLTLISALILIACRHESAGSSDPQQRESPQTSADGRTALFGSDLQFEEIRKKFQVKDRNQMANAILQMMAMRGRPEVVSLMQATWDNDIAKYPDLNWKTIQDPQIRIVIARVLGSWYPSQLQYREYILDEIKKTEGMAKLNALAAFGSVATDADIEYLEEIAKQPDVLAATGALSALQMYGSDAAIQALERVKSDPGVSEQIKTFTAQLLGLPREARE